MCANQEMRHFCCNILDRLPALLTLFYFNLLSHTVDLGKLKVVVQLLFPFYFLKICYVYPNSEKL